MRHIKALILGVLQSSILWGGLGSVAFFTLIFNDILPASKFLVRYTSREWVQCVETIFFFIGIAELLIKSFDTAEQRSRLRKVSLLGDRPDEPLPVANTRLLLDRLKALPSRDRHSYLGRQVREALEVIQRKQSADSLEDELKYLSQLGAARAHAGYAFVRIVIWAIPIWGFLGTVIGITDAIANLNPATMEASLGQVTHSLGGVFDTTALALMLSISLMFAQFFVDRAEGTLISEVDAKVAEELTGLFETNGTSNDPQLASFERMARVMLQSAEQLVDRRIEGALGKSLAESLRAHAQQLAVAENESADRNRRQWSRIQKGLVECSQALQTQGDLLLQVIEATGRVAKLEDVLNRNLSTLAGAQHYQETLLNLSAAIHLLNARLGQVAPAAPHIELQAKYAGEAA